VGETTLLYALSTIAQTCAALAAFVGAVGLFRLQILREQRKEKDQTRRLYIYAFRDPQSGGWKTPLGYGPSLDPAEVVEQEIERLERSDSDHPAGPAHRRWKASAPPIRKSCTALIFFEALNVGLIAASLIGFNHINALACARWTFWALWGVALATLGVTVYCVVVCTKGVEQ